MPDSFTKLKVQLLNKYAHSGHALCGEVTVDGKPSKVDWIAAQIHGHVAVDPDVLTIPTVKRRTSSLSFEIEDQSNDTQKEGEENILSRLDHLPDITSFSGRSGACIYSSHPYFFVTSSNNNQVTSPLQQTFRINIPQDLCPSFHSRAASVFYILSITIKPASYKDPASDVETLSLHLPIEIYNCKTPYYFNKPAALIEGEKKGQDKNTPIEPFASMSDEMPMSLPSSVRRGYEPRISIVPSLLHDRSASSHSQIKKSSFVYSLAKENSHLVRLILAKKTFYPGEVVHGILDFSSNNVRCFQIAGCLKLQEKTTTMGLPPDQILETKVCDSFLKSISPSCLQGSFTLSIPTRAVPSIVTDLIQFEWVVDFEFLTRKDDTNKYQVFQWHIPLQIHPPTTKLFNLGPQEKPIEKTFMLETIYSKSLIKTISF